MVLDFKISWYKVGYSIKRYDIKWDPLYMIGNVHTGLLCEILKSSNQKLTEKVEQLEKKVSELQETPNCTSKQRKKLQPSREVRVRSQNIFLYNYVFHILLGCCS